jgi:hypothetical protein
MQVIEKCKKQNKVVFATSAIFWERNIDSKDSKQTKTREKNPPTKILRLLSYVSE